MMVLRIHQCFGCPFHFVTDIDEYCNLSPDKPILDHSKIPDWCLVLKESLGVSVRVSDSYTGDE